MRQPKPPRPDEYPTEAESALLACLCENNAWIEHCGPLAHHPEWISNSRKDAATVVFDLIHAGQVADEISVSDELRRRLDPPPTYSEVNALLYTSAPVSGFSARTYAEQIIRAASERHAYRWGEKIALAALENGDTLQSLVDARAADLAAFQNCGDNPRLVYQLLTAEQAEALEPSQGILGDILYESSVAILYAKSGRWKSFLGLAMGFACATGGTLFGRRSRQGSVVYIAAEGARNIGKRITALRMQHDRHGETIPLYVLGRSVNLLDASGVRRLISDIRAQLGDAPLLVIIDTMARSMPGGNENDAKDINAVYDAAQAIKEAFGCCALIVHHDGKETTRGARGSSAIYGNADTVLRITGHEASTTIFPGDTVKLECEKPKDDAPFDAISFTTEKRQWATESGVFYSSLVVTPSVTQEEADEPRPLTELQESVLSVLTAVFPDGLTSAEWEEESGVSERTFYKIRKALEERKLCWLDRETKTYRTAHTAMGREPGKQAATAQLPTPPTAQSENVGTAQLPTTALPYRGEGSAGSTGSVPNAELERAVANQCSKRAKGNPHNYVRLKKPPYTVKCEFCGQPEPPRNGRGLSLVPPPPAS